MQGLGRDFEMGSWGRDFETGSWGRDFRGVIVDTRPPKLRYRGKLKGDFIDFDFC